MSKADEPGLATPKLGNMLGLGKLRWWIIGLVTLGTVLNYLARSSLSVAAPTLKETFTMSTEQYSYVVMAFQIAYTVMQPVAGSVIDALGTRLGFAIFAAGWAIANMMHAFATGWPSLAFFRGLLGATEAAAIPGGLKVVSEWFPARERTVATGWFNMGSSLGNMIAPPLVAFCILYFGWQSAFVVTGGISLIWAMLWYRLYRRPERHARLGEAERAHILDGRVAETGARSIGWRAIIRTRRFWSIAIPRFLSDPAWQTFNFFIPLYLVAAWDLDLKQIALWAWLPFLAADLGSLAGGYLAPFTMRRFGASLITSRKIVMTSGAVLMLGPACIGLASGPGVAIALFCIGGFAHQMLSGALLTLAADLFDSSSVGTASGMAGSAAWIGGTLFTFIIGQSADLYGYEPLFAALGVLDVLAAIVLWTLLVDARRSQSTSAVSLPRR
jgi:MFS transporter, ACS family, hexuronate transporter